MFPLPSSYDDLLKRITRRMQQDEVDKQILLTLQLTFDQELGQANHVLSRPERNRLFQQVVQAVLTDVQRKIGGTP